MKIKRLYIIPVFLVSTTVCAWGPDGHGAIGILAVEQMRVVPRTKLESVLGSLDDQAIVDACNWPDAVRKSAQWQWTAPFHYVNIPQGESRYSQIRDCPEGQCVTEALKNYAVVLGDDQAHADVRHQAFNWVCHLTADLHQPLHAGFAQDRGGNDFMVQFGPDAINLHAYWDFALIRSHFADWNGLLGNLRTDPYMQTEGSWSPMMVNQWTEESHLLVEQELYPANPVLDLEYQQKSWLLSRQRLNIAAARLASILDSVLSPTAKDDE